MCAAGPPLVSVVLPVRDGERTIAQALASMQQQTLAAIEILVIDDGSRDGTRHVVVEHARADPRIRLIGQDALGLVAALNRGLDNARAPYVARMDADDESLPERLALQHAFLEKQRAVAALGSRVAALGPTIGQGWTRYLDWLNDCVTPEALERALLVESPLPHPSVMLRTDLVRALGGYGDVDGPEDYDLWLRLVRAGHVLAKLPEVLLRWRDDPRRLTRTDPRYRPAAFVALKADHLAQILRARSQHELVLWGAGKYGRQLARALVGQGLRVAAFIDIDPQKIGRQRVGRPVLDPDRALASHPTLPVLAAVPVPEAPALIRARLEAAGRIEGQSFWICA